MEYSLMIEPEYSQIKEQSKVLNLFCFGQFGSIRFTSNGYSANNIVFRNIIYFLVFNDTKNFVATQMDTWIKENLDLLVELNMIAITWRLQKLNYPLEEYKAKLSFGRKKIIKVITKDYTTLYHSILKLLCYENLLSKTTKSREMGGFFYLFKPTEMVNELKMYVEMKKAIR